MLSRSIILFITISLIAVSWSSCEDDTAASEPTLIGRWEIEEATRNGRATESLVDLYMVFTKEGVFETNLSGEVAQGKYVFEEEVITTTDVPLAMEYRVAALTDTTLQLKSTFRNYRFDFSFQRKGKEENTESSKLMPGNAEVSR